MTIVAALKTPRGVWMGADSLASSSELRVDSSTPKVHKFHNFLFGFSGSYGAGALFLQVIRENRDITVKQLVKDYEPRGSDWEMLFADESGVYEFQSGGGLVKMRSRSGSSYGVIGSASGVALGSLYCWHEGRESVMMALKAAAEHTNRVKAPFKIVSL